MPMKSYRKKAGMRRRRWNGRSRKGASKGRYAGSSGITWTKKKLVSSVLPAGAPNAMTFKLTDVPDNQTYATLYDQYKITGIKVDIFPQETVNQGTGTTNFVIPTISYSVDQDDNSTTWSESDLLQRENVRTRLFNRPISIYLKPQPYLVDQGNSAMHMPSQKSIWLSTHDGNDLDQTPYFGLKYIVSNGGGSSQPTYFRTVTTYYLAFKQGRTKST